MTTPASSARTWIAHRLRRWADRIDPPGPDVPHWRTMANPDVYLEPPASLIGMPEHRSLEPISWDEGPGFYL